MRLLHLNPCENLDGVFLESAVDRALS